MEKSQVQDEPQAYLRYLIDQYYCKLKTAIDSQTVIFKGLTPEVGFENIQAEQIKILNNISYESEVYEKLPIEILINYAEGKTAAAGHYSKLISEYAMTHNKIEMEPVGIEPAQLPKICDGKETLIISNPALSTLVLTSTDLLIEISRRLKRNLVLLIWPQPNPVQGIWEGFSALEKEEGKILFKWALGNYRYWNIRLFNTLQRPVEVELKWSAQSLSGAGKFIASCNGEVTNSELHGNINFYLKTILHPGVNNLEFNFTGQSIVPGNNDDRLLAFRIINFSCYIDNSMTDQLSLYNGSYFPPMLNDDFIRRQLHKNGFFDVNVKAYSNHGFSIINLPGSRYHHIISVGGTYKKNESNNEKIPEEAIIIYRACRLRRKDSL